LLVPYAVRTTKNAWSEPLRTISRGTAKVDMSSTMDGPTLSSALEDHTTRNFMLRCLSPRSPAHVCSITSPMKAKRFDWRWLADCGSWQIRPVFHQRMLHLHCRMRSPR